MDETPDEAQLVFNLVWTEGAFDYLRLFTSSLLAQTRARFRFVANACAAHEIEAMARWADAHPDRIVEVMVVSEGRTLRHGDALDAVHKSRDDGPWFSLIDPDILARGPFAADFLDVLGTHDVVTSGKELWSSSNVLPDGHLGVNGEYFFRADGYAFGSPHFAIYNAGALRETAERWGVRFGEGGSGLGDEAKARLEAAGLVYWMYDTGKLVNIFMQEDGHSLCHQEHDSLVHIGGLLHFLWAPRVTDDAGTVDVDWASWKDMSARHQVARYSAQVLQALAAGQEAPEFPTGIDDDLAPRLGAAREEITAAVGSYGDEWRLTVGRRDLDQGAASSYLAFKPGSKDR